MAKKAKKSKRKPKTGTQKPKKTKPKKPKAKPKTKAQRMASIRKLRGNKRSGAVNQEAERRRTLWRRKNPKFNVPPLTGFIVKVELDLIEENV